MTTFCAVHDPDRLELKLQLLDLPVARDHWVALCEQATHEGWTFQTFLSTLAEAELAHREQAEPPPAEPPARPVAVSAEPEPGPDADTQEEVFVWTARLETGIARIDDEHRTLVELLNRLAVHLGRRSDADVLDAVFAELATYADVHFQSEEAVWAPVFGNDPWFRGHQAVHRSFLEQVGRIKATQGERPLEEVMDEILKLLIRWLAQHILDDDLRLAKVVHARNEGLSLAEAKLRAESEMSGGMQLFIDAVLDMYQLLSSRTLDLMRERTARGRINAALRSAKVAAERGNRAKSEFLASMSHELRTPLNAIIGFSEVLADETFGPLNKRQARYVGHILSSGRHLLSLINDILDLSKVEAGKQTLSPQKVGVVELVNTSLTLFKEKAQKHHIRLDFDPGSVPAGLVVEADERKLKQVFFNLLSNAVKFTPDGGTVSVRVASTQDELEVQVQDTGIGLAPDDLERVFSAFEQVDSSYGRQQQGTGLGLALSRELVQLHGGRIWAESDGPGLGTRFTVVVPMQLDAALAEEHA